MASEIKEQDARAGDIYLFGYEDLDLDIAGPILVTIETPANRSVEIEGEYQAMGGNVTVEFFEGCTTSADGTAITPVNSNYQSPNACKTKVYHTPTVTGNGTLKRSRTIFSASNVPSKAQSGAADLLPRILKPSTKYLIKMTAAADNSLGGAYIQLTERTP